jgi:hypothetical protein
VQRSERVRTAAEPIALAEPAWDTSAPGILWNNRHGIAQTFNDGVDVAGSALKTSDPA